MTTLVNRLWYGPRSFFNWLLWPFSWFYQLSTFIRRHFLILFYRTRFPVPIIVVGNLSVGGVGKTPLVIALAQKLQQQGLRVGIVSRGYGAKIKQFPYEVLSGDQANQVGDEPLLLVQKTQIPVIIDPNRVRAVHYLLKKYCPQVIISDDGLQHYRMGRAIEIAVIDGTRHLGNGFCLPAGPLRESKARLKKVDFVVVNGEFNENKLGHMQHYHMHLKPGAVTKLSTLETIDPSTWGEDKVIAVAGIGNPQRFYFTLQQLGIKFTKKSYPDHYQFQASDLDCGSAIVIMTEKDAVKCQSFYQDNLYFLPVAAIVEDSFWNALWTHQQLQGYC